MNLPHMGLFEVGYVRFEPDLFSDKVYVAFQALFFDGRFRSLFCILFAIGLYLQSLSYQRQQLDSDVIIKSRLNWLFIFGLMHCAFLWPGDILMMYALSGLYLKSKLEWSADKLLKKGILFFAIGMGLLAAEITLVYYIQEGVISRNSTEFLEALAVIKGSYFDILEVNIFFAIFIIITFPFLGLFYIGGVMMIGLGLFKSEKLQQGFTQKGIWLLFIATLVLSVIDAFLASSYPSINQLFAGAIGSVSGLTMALLICHFVVTSNCAKSKSWLANCLQRVGRMAFTFYIIQSLVMAGLFRYLFPQWNEVFDLVDYALISISFILLQMLIANYYFSYFKQGPLEKLWRVLVNKTVDAQKQKLETNQLIQKE